MLRLLTISGSLREGSSNSHLMRAAQLLCPADTVIAPYDAIGDLPHFNPDLMGDPPGIIRDLYATIRQADGLLISCPEYARGIPGSFKNMLDWLVGCEDFPGKPVALFNASPRANDAQAALKLVLETMSAEIVEEASITVNLLSAQLSAEGITADPGLRSQIERAVKYLGAYLNGKRR